MKSAFIFPACLLWLVHGSPFHPKTAPGHRRDILGIFGDTEPAAMDPGKGVVVKPEIPIATPTLPVTTTRDAIITILHTAQATTTARLGTATTPTSPSTTIAAGAATTTPTAGPQAASSGTLTASSSSTSSAYEYNIEDEPEAPDTPPGELTEWKVIGIAVTTITFFATIVLSVVFFDSWWGFLRAALCGVKRAKEGEETLVPDWNKRSWEFKLANEDGHRYPTMASLESIVKEKERARWREEEAQAEGSLQMPDIKSPEMVYGGMR